MEAIIKSKIQGVDGFPIGSTVRVVNHLKGGDFVTIEDQFGESTICLSHNLTMVNNFAERVHQWNKDFGVKVSKEPCTPSDEDIELGLRLIEEEFKELVQAIRGGEGNRQIVKESCDFVFTIFGNLSRWGLSGDTFNRAMDEVIRSNDSKKQPDGTVKRREDGKILKGENYFKAKLEFIND